MQTLLEMAYTIETLPLIPPNVIKMTKMLFAKAPTSIPKAEIREPRRIVRLNPIRLIQTLATGPETWSVITRVTYVARAGECPYGQIDRLLEPNLLLLGYLKHKNVLFGLQLPIHIVACQGSGVSIKATAQHTDKSYPCPLAR